MHTLARARLELARRPWLSLAVAAALAVAAGAVAATAVAGVDGARRSWGATRAVVVATTDIAPGDDLAARTELRRRPEPAVAAASLSALPDAAVSRQHVAAGETLVAADVAATAGPRSLLPVGWSAVAVAEPVPTGAAVGDPVLAVAGGVELAGGVVVGRSGDALLVGFPSADAPGVADAALAGTLSLLLRP